MIFDEPGKYDEEATYIRTNNKATGVALIVMEGINGSGFSVQMPLKQLMQLPAILEHMAHAIRQDLNQHGIQTLPIIQKE